MAKQRPNGTQAADAQAVSTAKKGVTPPKGRPTRSRDGGGGRKRAFGPVAQWVTVAALVALVVVVLVLVTDGGDFNPFNDDDAPTQFGAPAPAAVAT